MLEAQYRTTLEYPGTLAQSWAPSWLSESPKSLETPEIPDKIEPTPSETYFSDAADPAECDSLPRFPDEVDADNEFFWQQLTDQDREYLKWHRDYPAPCPWCGGRSRHNPTCDELRASWEVVMPFGKWKGKPLSVLPQDYLAWLLSNTASLDKELREAINTRLGGFDNGRFDHYVAFGELLP